MSILNESILFLEQVIIEGRKEDAFKKYPQFVDEIKFFIQNDPLKKLKYLDWELKQLSQGNFSKEEIIQIVNDFDRFQSTLSNKDITKYDFKTLKNELESIKEKQNKKKEKVEKRYRLENKPDVDVIYESKTWKIIFLKNKEAACHYGLDTKWCISQKDKEYFNEYSDNNVAMYVLFNKDNKEKYACALDRTKSNKFSWFDVADNQIDDIIKNILKDEYDVIYQVLIDDSKEFQKERNLNFQKVVEDYQNYDDDTLFKILTTNGLDIEISKQMVNYFYDKYKNNFEMIIRLIHKSISNELLTLIYSKLDEYGDDEKHDMKTVFLQNNNTPVYIIKELTNDKNSYIRLMAKHKLIELGIVKLDDL